MYMLLNKYLCTLSPLLVALGVFIHGHGISKKCSKAMVGILWPSCMATVHLRSLLSSQFNPAGDVLESLALGDKYPSEKD